MQHTLLPSKTRDNMHAEDKTCSWTTGSIWQTTGHLQSFQISFHVISTFQKAISGYLGSGLLQSWRPCLPWHPRCHPRCVALCSPWAGAYEHDANGQQQQQAQATCAHGALGNLKGTSRLRSRQRLGWFVSLQTAAGSNRAVNWCNPHLKNWNITLEARLVHDSDQQLVDAVFIVLHLAFWSKS